MNCTQLEIMTTKNYMIVFSLCGLVFFGCSTIRQEKVSFRSERQKLLSRGFELKLPVPFHLQKENYEEGVVYFYSFNDSAYIVVFEGAMMEFPMDKYPADKQEIKNERITSVGRQNNKFWRKDVMGGVRIYYDNVSSKNKNIYDKALDEIKINPL